MSFERGAGEEERASVSVGTLRPEHDDSTSSSLVSPNVDAMRPPPYPAPIPVEQHAAGMHIPIGPRVYKILDGESLAANAKKTPRCKLMDQTSDERRAPVTFDGEGNVIDQGSHVIRREASENVASEAASMRDDSESAPKSKVHVQKSKRTQQDESKVPAIGKRTGLRRTVDIRSALNTVTPRGKVLAQHSDAFRRPVQFDSDGRKVGAEESNSVEDDDAVAPSKGPESSVVIRNDGSTKHAESPTPLVDVSRRVSSNPTISLRERDGGKGVDGPLPLSGISLPGASVVRAPSSSLSTPPTAASASAIPTSPTPLAHAAPGQVAGAELEVPLIAIPIPMSGELSKKEVKLFHIANEVLSTEHRFYSSLCVAIDVFLVPLRERSLSQGQEALLQREEVEEVFRNIESIRDCSRAFLGRLAALATDHLSLADVYLQAIEDKLFNDVYREYINGQSVAMRLVREKYKSNAEFGKFLDECKADPRCRNESLSSFLHMPIQRIPRYCLFLRDFCGCLREDSPQLVSGKKAAQGLETLTAHLDASKEAIDQFRVLCKGISTGQFDPDQSRVVLASGSIETNGKGARSRVKAELFVFEDVIACISKANKTYVFDWCLDVVSLSIVEHDDAKTGSTYFELRQSKHISQYPFAVEVSFFVYPGSEPPYDIEYWRRGFEASIASCWLKKRSKIQQASSSLAKHMETTLLSPQDWKMLTLGAASIHWDGQGNPPVLLKEGDVNEKLFYVWKGSVRIEKSVEGRTIQLSVLREGELFGELSLLSEEKTAASATCISNEPGTVVAAMPFGNLVSICNTQPQLSERFYRLVCVKLANRFVHQPLKRALDEGRKDVKGAGVRGSEQRGASCRDSLTPAKEQGRTKKSKATSTQKSRDAEAESATHALAKNAATVKKLGLPATECVVHEFPCKLRDRVKGKYYVMQEHVAFVGRFFGSTEQFVLHKSQLLGTCLAPGEANVLSIGAMQEGTMYYRLRFKEEEEVEKALSCTQALAPTMLAPEQRRLKRRSKAISEEQAMRMKKGRSEELKHSRTRERRGSTIQERQVLRGQSISLTALDWQLLECASSVRRYSKDEVIISTNARAGGLYQLLQGSCTVQLPRGTKGNSGETVTEVLGTVHKAGEVFGHIAFILGTFSTAEVVAAEDNTEVVCFDRNQLNTVFAEAPDVAAGFYEHLACQIRDLFLHHELAHGSDD